MQPRLSALVLSLSLAGVAAATPTPAPLWPTRPPGEDRALPPEADMTKPTDNLIAGRRLIRLGNVTMPTLAVYKPDPAKDTGAAVVVCPGGGYNILALDLEGTEVCDWLNAIGVTGVLLKYRVPQPEGPQRHAAPLQDAQRAVGLVRHQARELGLDPQRIGVLGFSAGAHLAATLSNHFEPRTYPAVDAADAVSCRPDFVVLIYPGGLTAPEDMNRISPLVAPTKDKTPPTFITMAEDDPVRVENAYVYYVALKQAGVPAELHLYPTGGHGYGLRRTDNPVTFWPDRVTEWMAASGWLKRAKD